MSDAGQELVAFVRARLDDTVREQQDPCTGWHARECESLPDGDRPTFPCDCGAPRRVLAEIDAKRRIVDLHSVVYREIGWLEGGQEQHDEIPVCGHCVPRHSHYQRRGDMPEGPCLTVRLLALAWSDHPDYRPEWGPDA